MNWKDKKVLVTGSAGVIGKELLKRLTSKGAQILSIDIKPLSEFNSIKHIQADLSASIPKECIVFEPEIIFHLAATFERTVETAGYWKINFDNNVFASHKLLESMDANKALKLFVFASSYLTYDPKLYLDTSKLCYLKEIDPIAPRNLVGLAKYFTERELQFIEEMDKSFQVVSARIFRVYGYGSREIISRWIRTALKGEPIDVWGRQNHFDYIWAEDVAENLIRLAETDVKNNSIINLGSGVAHSIDEVVNILKKEIHDLKVKEIPTNSPVELSCADMNLFKELTGWLPQTSLEEGIHKIIEYERRIQENEKL